jgi:subfamily B ATP-binding cassette protein HlyB/CyaB
MALCIAARLHHIAAGPEHLAHALGMTGSQPIGVDDLLLAARHLGLKAKKSSSTTARLALLPLPALALMDDGRIVVLAQCDGKRVLLVDPGVERRDAMPRPSSLPTIESVEAFAAGWTGRLILIASRASLAGALAKFDFSWFIPSLVKYRKLFGEVLVVSLFLQLFALVSPLFFQVVMDKVLVHRGLATLDVLVVGLIVVVVFESVLTTLRTYVFSHTTSRIDVELGARLFRHLVALPLAYFQARRVGDSVARVRELENIRGFLTGNALTLVLDLFFSVIFIAVMFAYSVPLTLIVLVSLPLYVVLSLVLVPILRVRLNEKFARGAENQALLVEAVTGIQTVKANALEPAMAKRWDNQLAAYVLGRGYGAELVQENDATAGNTDVARFLNGITDDQIWFRHVGNDLEVSLIGTTDKETLQNWYLGSQYHAEQFKTSDGHVLLDSSVQNLVNAMAAFAPPAVGQTTLPPSYQSALNPVIVANWGP